MRIHATLPKQFNHLASVVVSELKRNKCANTRRERNGLTPQSYLQGRDGGNAIRTVGVRSSGILLTCVVAKQEHLLAVEGVFRPGDA